MTKLTTRDKYLRRTYGITQAIYECMLRVHRGGCCVCERLPNGDRNLHVDHDHKTGQVRGLLCWLCNKRFIGRHRQEHIWKYLAAAEYLGNKKDWRQGWHGLKQ
jgi:hypothetical protein